MKLVAILAAVVFAGAAVPPAGANPAGGSQTEMRQATGSRNVLSLSAIEARVLPMMRGMEYLGPEYDAVAMAYRLKFIRQGRVVFVDVDARTGRIIGEQR